MSDCKTCQGRGYIFTTGDKACAIVCPGDGCAPDGWGFEYQATIADRVRRDYERTGEELTSPERAVQNAMGAIERDYWSDVKGVADDVYERVGEIIQDAGKDDCDFHSILHEAVDGTQRVIYTFQAQLGLLVSKNDGAYADSFGEEGMVNDGSINWSALMFAAMSQDVIEELEGRDLDVNDLASWFETEEEEAAKE